MAYGILTQDGTIQFAPKTYRDENTVIYNFSDSPIMMKKKGYYELHDGPHFQNIPEGKMEVPTYSLREPVGTVSYDPLIGDDGEIMKDENGNVITVENITYDIPEPYIQVTYSLIDAPQEDLISDGA